MNKKISQKLGMPRETRGTTRETRGSPIPGALNGINKCTSRYIRKIGIIITIIVSPQTTQPKVIFFKYREMSNQNTMAVFSKLCPKIILHFWLLIFHWTNVVCMSSSDLLIWRNFEFWSRNICYCLLSAEKKRVWLVNVFLLDQ